MACTSSVCTECAFSSNTVLASNGQSCLASTCTDINCVYCYTQDGTQKCQTCKTGYTVNSQYGCAQTTCSIAYCSSCTSGAATCALCINQGTEYQLSADYKSCNPICSDVNCVSCLRPAYCGTCATGYKIVEGVCKIDCTKNLVAQCKDCDSLTVCKTCNDGYKLILGGVKCSLVCNDANCQSCSTASVCVTCNQGYFLNSNGVC